MDPGGRIAVGCCCGGRVGDDMRYKDLGVFDWYTGQMGGSVCAKPDAVGG